MIHVDGSAIDRILLEKWEPDRTLAMSAIAYAEAIRGATFKPTDGFLIAKADVARGIISSHIFPFTRDIAEIFADLSPRRTGGQQARDLMIAATAIAHGAPLATNDRRMAALHGANVPGHAPLDIMYIE